MSLIEKISMFAGRAVELTIRGERNFTFSFDGCDSAASGKLVEFFGSGAKVTSDYDKECDQTCIYIDA